VGVVGPLLPVYIKNNNFSDKLLISKMTKVDSDTHLGKSSDDR